MNKKTILSTFILTSALYYVIPLLFLKFYNGSSEKSGLILILFFTFASFSITMLVSYFFERKLYIPLLNIILALPIFTIFNSSAIVLIIIIIIFSFVAYALSSLLK